MSVTNWRTNVLQERIRRYTDARMNREYLGNPNSHQLASLLTFLATGSIYPGLYSDLVH
jgi:hypothetical protein